MPFQSTSNTVASAPLPNLTLVNTTFVMTSPGKDELEEGRILSAMSLTSRENHVIKMVAFAVVCVQYVATALLCAVNSVQPWPCMVRTAMAPLMFVCALIFLM